MRRKLIASQFLTLDGVMSAPEQWNSKFLNDTEIVSEILSDFSGSDLLLLGKTTYDFFAARWPSRTSAMADHLNTCAKVVISTTLQSAEWNNTKIIRDNKMEEIVKLKEQPGRNIIVLGSYQLVQSLIVNDLIDEYKLYIHPLTLGKGKRLFDLVTPPLTLKLITARPFASGVIAAVYQTEKTDSNDLK